MRASYLSIAPKSKKGNKKKSLAAKGKLNGAVGKSTDEKDATDQDNIEEGEDDPIILQVHFTGPHLNSDF